MCLTLRKICEPKLNDIKNKNQTQEGEACASPSQKYESINSMTSKTKIKHKGVSHVPHPQKNMRA
jgi:hypothetical protein